MLVIDVIVVTYHTVAPRARKAAKGHVAVASFFFFLFGSDGATVCFSYCRAVLQYVPVRRRSVVYFA